MIEESERLIIIVGMAHSGTTILAYLLQQHPDITCCTNGTEGWILENSWLPLEQPEPIKELVRRFPNKRVLLKRPWNEVFHGDWMAAEMPNARYLYCLRSFEDTAKSWSKPNSFVDFELRNASTDRQREMYDGSLLAADIFSKKVPFFKTVRHDSLLANPHLEMLGLRTWLDLKPFQFDVSKVSATQNIKDLLSVATQPKLVV